MKKLQNNFTTPEQSKRLFELGVPADSADCVLVRNLYFPKGEYEIKVLDGKYSRFIEMHDTWEIIPCWSFGRLMEIYCLCTGVEYIKIGLSEITLVELMIKIIEISVNAKSINFSKLED